MSHLDPSDYLKEDLVTPMKFYKNYLKWQQISSYRLKDY